MSDLSVDEQREHKDLVSVFRKMGFPVTEAHLMASAHIEPFEAEKLLTHGCSLRLAFRILL